MISVDKTVHFASFCFDLGSGRLSKAGISLKLQPQPTRVLALLIQRAGEVVSREEIQEVVWDEDTFVDFDLGINSCIRQIRTILEDNTDKPRFVETVPRRGYCFIAPLKEVSPVEETPVEEPRKSAARLWKPVAAAALVVVIGVGVSYLAPRLEPVVQPDRVAVATFENLTGQTSLDSVGRIAADWIAQGLSRTGVVEVVPAGSVHTTIQALQASTGPVSFHGILDALAQKTQAGIIVTGDYYLHGDALEFQVQIADSQQGKLLGAIDPVSGTQDQPLDTIERLRQQVMGAVAAHIDPGHEIVKLSSQPPSFEAYQLYIKGEEAFVNGNMRGAIELFEPISEKSPTFLGHVPLLAMAYYNSGRWEDAKAVVLDLSERLDELSPHDVHKVEFLQARIDGDHAAALHAARHAAQLDPDFTWLEGLSALRLNRILEARDAFTRLNRGYADTARLRQWTPYWYHHSSTLHRLGEHEEELEIASEGRQYRPEAPRRVFSEVRALVGLGRVTEALQLLEENLGLPDISAPLWHPGRLMMETSLELQSHSHLGPAEELLQRALAWYRSRPPEEAKNESIRSYFAQTLHLAGYEEEAESLLRELSAEKPDNLDYRGGLGVLAACLGDPKAARETVEYLRNLDRPYLFGHHFYWQAAIAAHLGERQLAVDLLREGFTQGLPYSRVFSRGLHHSVDFASLRNYAPFQALMRPK